MNNCNDKNETHVIAYYLPQYHPVKENNEWWGMGFTEWTNVAKAKPLFKGHEQPKIPADLGFYDLRYPEIKELQAMLAKEAGVSAFCYWHYWFGKNKRILEKPFEDVLKSGNPNFPFCLGWANHDWQKKDWSSEESIFIRETLLEQTYNGIEDYTAHFYDMLPAFQDNRYYKINGRLVFVIFRPDSIPDTNEFISTWNQLSTLNGLPEFFFIACIMDKSEVNKYISLGYQSVNLSLLNYPFKIKYSKSNIIYRILKSKLFGIINSVEYSKAIKIFNDPMNSDPRVAPTIIPNWDHTPRSGKFGHVLHKSTPELFAKHVEETLESIKNKQTKIIFLKSWNEWGEGNYLEPDLKYGKQYIDALGKLINKFRKTYLK